MEILMRHPAQELREQLAQLKQQYLLDNSMSDYERQQFNDWIAQEEAQLKILESAGASYEQ